MRTGPSDSIQAVATDGNIYTAGSVNKIFSGHSSARGTDAFLRALDSAGNELWNRQFGTSSSDSAVAVGVDATGVYIAG